MSVPLSSFRVLDTIPNPFAHAGHSSGLTPLSVYVSISCPIGHLSVRILPKIASAVCVCVSVVVSSACFAASLPDTLLIREEEADVDVVVVAGAADVDDVDAAVDANLDAVEDCPGAKDDDDEEEEEEDDDDDMCVW
eukprot:CAMPEP_0197524250 /NCGR_PEP_ID=MMETSP1318-20131121/8979_1 /TAXON_ID=552666 /ORGANISM="Partenskyella glossopodia, Strain RCC365" /LENGTH=136 /DNA_ID=CAMNT_0043077165 /DNA_START=149 /DNA_END=556 /DNA_ORIENTATION=-